MGLAEEQKTLRGCAFENPVTGRIKYFVSNTMIPGEKSAVHIGRTKDDCVKCWQILKSVARQAGWLFSEAKEQELSTCIRSLGYNLTQQTGSLKYLRTSWSWS